MALFDRGMFAHPDDTAGVFIDGLGRALITWAAMQNRLPVTVAEAALAFNTTPDVIKEAIGETYWASIDGPEDNPTIELDGE